MFAEAFDLLVDGLAVISEMPKDKIFDVRSIVSLTGEPVTLSGLKSQMKMHYRLLCDIMAKSISVKAGSFNAITVEKFSLLTAVVCDVQMNWGLVLFGFLKKMVTPGSKQAKGFAIQISLLLESVPNLELGASSEFPSSKILTDKTIHRYIVVIDKSGAQEPADAPKVKKTPKTKVASRKRPADIPLDVPVVKKKRTSKKKSSLKLVAVAQEAIPIQIVPAESAVEPMVEDQQAENEDAADRPAAEEETPADRPAEEIVSVEERVDESLVEVSGVDVVDPETVIQQVLNQMDFSTKGQDVAKGDRVETWFDRTLAEEIATAGDDSPTEKVNAEEIPWFVHPFLSVDHDNERIFETGSDSADTMDFEVHSQTLPVVRETNVDPAADIPLPSVSIEITKIKMGTQINIPGVDEKRCYLASLPQITADDKGKALLVEKDPVKEMSKKEDIVLYWGETESIHEALSRNRYILLKYREMLVRKFLESWKKNFKPGEGTSATDLQVIDMLWERHLDVLQELSKQKITHGLLWDRPCCSAIFEGSPRDRGVVIARTNTNTPSSNRDDGAALKDTILMHLRDIEKKFTARFDAQDRWIGALCNDSNDQRNLLSLEFNSSHKKLHSQLAAASTDQIDMQRKMTELNAKVDAIAMNLERVKRDAEATKEAILHQLFEFQSQAQENQNILHAQLSELVDYIHRGGADKKGKSGSRGPQQP
ncbi:structural maintenance of chromosomes protein 2-1-like [Dorcoceras hygrometricum]|uniref:Structural maintenance of chromosomes protein 2-1-like n=1 Tax=Dorcoceras hygrometricum TaxID=472368 RepID=A0A2Z7D6G5_9LAMI|nr:structural maintenance of chromosomes protein 2-1-like [Dorcoceras hygrometricum]